MTERIAQIGAYIEIGDETITVAQIGAYIEILAPFETVVVSGIDDVEEADDGTGFVSDGLFTIVESNITAPNRKNSAFRFIDVIVPKDATVLDAVLVLQAYDVTDDNLSTDVYGENTDNSEDFVTNPKINNRDKTTATMPWEADNTGVVTIYSPNLKDIVQEITNRLGWESGNAMTILLFGKKTGSKKYKAKAFEASSGEEAQLYILYEMGKDVVLLSTFAISINI